MTDDSIKYDNIQRCGTPDISKVYTANECRELDRLTIEEHDIPGFTLMQRAGLYVCDRIHPRWTDCSSLRVVAGTGNNAGDGYIVAILAHQGGAETEVYQVGDPKRLHGDALLAWNHLQKYDIPIVDKLTPSDIIVDALLGTGARGEVSSRYKHAIAEINDVPGSVVAVDVPSGVDASTGALLTEEPVRPWMTCMFIGAKLGLFTGPGLDYLGWLRFTDLGIPTEVYHEDLGVTLLDSPRPESRLPRRPSLLHKYQFGHIVIVGGDHGMGGAVVLAAEAALRTGAGLVTVLTQPEHIPAILARVPPVMAVGIDESTEFSAYLSRADVLVVGPGLGQKNWGHTLLQTVLNSQPKQCVLDADALRLIKKEDWNVPCGSILTPHPGEAAFMTDKTTTEVQADRPDCAKQISQHYDCTVILKGPGTLIASRGKLCSVSSYVDGSLATAGSGDVLTGIVAACYALTRDPVLAAEAAVCLHGAAAKLFRDENSNKSLIASDLVDYIRI